MDCHCANHVVPLGNLNPLLENNQCFHSYSSLHVSSSVILSSNIQILYGSFCIMLKPCRLFASKQFVYSSCFFCFCHNEFRIYHLLLLSCGLFVLPHHEAQPLSFRTFLHKLNLFQYHSIPVSFSMAPNAKLGKV